jgi:hypothetical protein
MILDKISLFEGGSISRKNLCVNKIFTGIQNTRREERHEKIAYPH